MGSLACWVLECFILIVSWKIIVVKTMWIFFFFYLQPSYYLYSYNIWVNIFVENQNSIDSWGRPMLHILNIGVCVHSFIFENESISIWYRTLKKRPLVKRWEILLWTICANAFTINWGSKRRMWWQITQHYFIWLDPIKRITKSGIQMFWYG